MLKQFNFSLIVEWKSKCATSISKEQLTIEFLQKLLCISDYPFQRKIVSTFIVLHCAVFWYSYVPFVSSIILICSIHVAVIMFAYSNIHQEPTIKFQISNYYTYVHIDATLSFSRKNVTQTDVEFLRFVWQQSSMHVTVIDCSIDYLVYKVRFIFIS